MTASSSLLSQVIDKKEKARFPDVRSVRTRAFCLAKFADAELDAAGGRDLAAFFNSFGRKDINNGHARIGNALFAGFGKVQHGLISTGEGWALLHGYIPFHPVR